MGVAKVLQHILQDLAERHITVAATTADEIHLTVSDSGVGFDPEDTQRGPGLGITSMRERLRLVDGQIYIDSSLGHGTTIRASVPFSPKVKSAISLG